MKLTTASENLRMFAFSVSDASAAMAKLSRAMEPMREAVRREERRYRAAYRRWLIAWREKETR